MCPLQAPLGQGGTHAAGQQEERGRGTAPGLPQHRGCAHLPGSTSASKHVKIRNAQVPLTLKPVFCLPVPSLQVRRCKKEQLVWLERRLCQREQVVQFLTIEFFKSQPKNENIKTARSN